MAVEAQVQDEVVSLVRGLLIRGWSMDRIANHLEIEREHVRLIANRYGEVEFCH